MGAWLLANGEGVYGTQPVAVKAPEGVILTCKETAGGKWVYAFLTRPIQDLTLDLTGAQSAEILETGMPLNFENRDGRLLVHIPDGQVDGCSLQVVKIKLAE